MIDLIPALKGTKIKSKKTPCAPSRFSLGKEILFQVEITDFDELMFFISICIKQLNYFIHLATTVPIFFVIIG